MNLLIHIALLLTGSISLADGKDFTCPEEFGYFSHPTDCGLYYVCVYGGPIVESCAGGLVFSSELKTCDWPRNVVCKSGSEDITSDNSEPLLQYKKETYRQPRKQDKKPLKTITNEVEFVEKTTSTSTSTSTSPPSTEGRGITRSSSGTVQDSGGQQFRPTTIFSGLQTGLDIAESIQGVNQETFNDIHKPDYGVQQQFTEKISTEKSTTHAPTPPTQTTENSAVLPKFGAKQLETAGSSDPEATRGPSQEDIRSIEQELLAAYPGVSTGLEDYQETNPGSDQFYYVNWDDPIYDQFEDFSLEDEDGDYNDYEDSTEVNPKPEKVFNRKAFNQSRGKDDLPVVGSPAQPCRETNCKLPLCRCGDTSIPQPITRGNLSMEEVPQLVLLSFDDSVNDLNKRLYEEVFRADRKNPNGCPIAATFFVSHEWTDYGQVQSLYADGHEIASHSISHSFGEQFSKRKWLKEMVGQREILSAFGGVREEDIRGIRAPFLAIGGNNMFSMLYEANFTYDSSMPIYDNKPPMFPYTLDYKLSHDCMIPPCPNKAYPGVWEVPLVMWNDLQGGRCSMADACSNPRTAQDVYLMILSNFMRHYTTNRAPFNLFYHPAWFTTPHHKEGFELFLDTIVAMEDVWLVTAWQSIEWMKDPTSLKDINSFSPFQCDYKNRPGRCIFPKVCNLWHKSGVRYMRTCQQCPSFYPWTGRTGVN